MRRRNLLTFSLLTGTTTFGYASTSSAHSKGDLVLQDPFPGQAILYLIRPPGDVATIAVLLDGVKVVDLPESGYTVLLTHPGTRRLASATASGPEPVIEISIAEGERRFFYLSGLHGRPMGAAEKVLPLFGMLGFAAGAAFNQPKTASGTRTWKECGEQDARDLMSIARLVLPG